MSGPTVILSVLSVLVAADNTTTTTSSSDLGLEIAAGLIWALVVLGIFIYKLRQRKATRTMKKHPQQPIFVEKDETYVEFDRLSVETSLETSMAWDSPITTPLESLDEPFTPGVFFCLGWDSPVSICNATPTSVPSPVTSVEDDDETISVVVDEPSPSDTESSSSSKLRETLITRQLEIVLHKAVRS